MRNWPRDILTLKWLHSGGAEMITDYHKRRLELLKLSKNELHQMIGAKCGVHVSCFSKSQLRRTRKQLVESLMSMDSELCKYDQEGMLK